MRRVYKLKYNENADNFRGVDDSALRLCANDMIALFGVSEETPIILEMRDIAFKGSIKLIIHIEWDDDNPGSVCTSVRSGCYEQSSGNGCDLYRPAVQWFVDNFPVKRSRMQPVEHWAHVTVHVKVTQDCDS